MIRFRRMRSSCGICREEEDFVKQDCGATGDPKTAFRQLGISRFIGRGKVEGELEKTGRPGPKALSPSDLGSFEEAAGRLR